VDESPAAAPSPTLPTRRTPAWTRANEGTPTPPVAAEAVAEGDARRDDPAARGVRGGDRPELTYASGIRDFRDIAPYDWATLSGPVRGHPERVIGYVPLTPAERGLWAQLVDLPYR
jgi:hypothetical protein